MCTELLLSVPSTQEGIPFIASRDLLRHNNDRLLKQRIGQFSAAHSGQFVYRLTQRRAHVVSAASCIQLDDLSVSVARQANNLSPIRQKEIKDSAANLRASVHSSSYFC